MSEVNQPDADHPVRFNVYGFRVWARTHRHANQILSDAMDRHKEIENPCWFGGTCLNPAEFEVTHGFEAFGSETHHVCSRCLPEMIVSATRKVPGWGATLPVTVKRIKS